MVIIVSIVAPIFDTSKAASLDRIPGVMITVSLPIIKKYIMKGTMKKTVNTIILKRL